MGQCGQGLREHLHLDWLTVLLFPWPGPFSGTGWGGISLIPMVQATGALRAGDRMAATNSTLLLLPRSSEQRSSASLGWRGSQYGSLIRLTGECCLPFFFEFKMPLSVRCTTRKGTSQPLNPVVPSGWQMHPNFRDITMCKMHISNKVRCNVSGTRCFPSFP